MQATVILATLGLLSAGIYGTCNIKVEFDPFKMLSQDSYLKQFLDFYKEEFPRSGWPANVYTGELRFVVEDFEAVDKVGHQKKKMRFFNR